MGLLFLAGLCLAQDDVIRLKTGEDIQGEILARNRRAYVIWVNNQEQTIPRENVEYVVYGILGRVNHRWSVGLMGTVQLFSTAPALKHLFNQNGLTETPPDADETYPVKKPGPGVFLEAEYLPNPRLGFGLIGGYANEGRSEGYLGGNNLKFTYGSGSLAAFARWYSADHLFHAYAGPVLEYAWLKGKTSVEEKTEQQLNFGVMGGGGVSIIERRMSFLRFELQYRLMPSLTAGPFANTEGQVLFPKEKVSFSYMAVGFSVGFNQ